MQEFHAGTPAEAVAGAGKHPVGIVDTRNVDGRQPFPAPPFEDEVEQRAGAAGELEVIRAEVPAKEPELRGQRAAVCEREDEEAAEVIPPRLGGIGLCDLGEGRIVGH